MRVVILPTVPTQPARNPTLMITNQTIVFGTPCPRGTPSLLSNMDDFKPSAALTRSLEQLHIIQRTRQKMVDKTTIGDGEVTMVYLNDVSKIYKGTVNVLKIQDDFQIEVRSSGKRQLLIPCEQITSCSVQRDSVILQFGMDFEGEKCVFKFYDNAQCNVLASKLPPVTKPTSTDCNSTDSSDTEYDSGNEKTENFKNNSFSSSSDELEEI